MGKPVVSTTIGAEGLPAHHGIDIFLADSPADFARCTIDLLGNDALRKQIGAAARELVASKYSWRAVAKEFAAALT